MTLIKSAARFQLASNLRLRQTASLLPLM